MNNARIHFKIRNLFLVNKIIAVVMILVSIVGFILGVIAEVNKNKQDVKEPPITDVFYEKPIKDIAHSVCART